MAKKIITFLSTKHDKAVEKDYICPNEGVSVKGKETNEAPLRYLYRENPEISEVICLVSDLAKAEVWEDFCLFVAQNAPNAVCTEIHYDEQRDSGELLSEIMSKIQPDDVIFLDVTGGFRTVMMDIMLLSRTMHYTGVTFGGAVYSEPGREKEEPGHIWDVTQLFDTFNMVEGMQELSSLGSTHMLRNYYDKRGKPDEKIDELLKSMDALFEAITLCRTSKIDECMKRFEVALKNARSCDDPLMQQLLPTFQKRFGEGLDALSLIEWCVKSNMLQQALTVYTERIPREIMRHVSGDGYTTGKKEYEDSDAFCLKGLLQLSCDMRIDGRDNPLRSLRNYINNKRNDLLDVVYDNKSGEPYPNTRSAVDNLSIVLRAAYPREDGAFCENWRERIPDGKQFLCYMDDWEWRCGVDRMLSKGMNESNLCKLFGADGYTMTLKNFRTLLHASNYRCVDCTETQLVDALKDYVYVKALRNMTNHANVESSSDQKLQMKYLNAEGYKVLEEVTASDIKDTLLEAVERVRNMRRK